MEYNKISFNPSQKTILIVEDALENIDILSALLKDYKKKIATDGNKALEICKQPNLPDLILLDIVLPGMNGYEVCEQLRLNEETQDIPIIFLTSKDSREDIIKGFELGSQDYIKKPFDPSELHARIKTQLELKHHREQLKSLNLHLENQIEKRTNQLKQANLELQALDASKADFINTISRQIKNPLSEIISSMQLIKELSDNEYILDLVDKLTNSVKSLEEFGNTAQLIKSIKSKTLSLNPEPFLLIDQISLSILGFTEKLSLQSILINTEDIPPDMSVILDKDVLHEIFVRIIDLVINLAPNNETIFLKAYKKKDTATIEVTAPGKDLPLSVFKGNIESPPMDTTPFSNTEGLNLYLIKELMHYINGKIEFSIADKDTLNIELGFN
jgi:DNA-binding response OmpR family regulator